MRYVVMLVLLLSGPDLVLAQSSQQAAETFQLALAKISAPLSVEQESPQGGGLQVGQPLELRLSADRNGYVTLVRIDAHGVLEMADPALSPAGGYLSSRAPQFLTPENVPEVLTARPPMGASHLFVLFTSKPIDKSALGLDALSRYAIVDATRSMTIVEQLTEQLGAQGSASTSSRHIVLDVTGHGGDQDYTPEQIVQYFTQTTRSIARPRLDVYVNFHFNSADVTSESMTRVDTWGRVLTDPLMAKQRFVIAGHTDDLGSDEYNLELSLRRAAAIRDLLIANYDIDSSRLEVKGYGKNRPLLPGTSEQERSANRRVDFERISGP